MSRYVDLTGLKTLEEKIVKVLEVNTECRHDDELLYFMICRDAVPSIAWLRVEDLINLRKELELPKYESISRIRRKVQTVRPDLCAGAVIKELKAGQEEVYKKYAEL